MNTSPTRSSPDSLPSSSLPRLLPSTSTGPPILGSAPTPTVISGVELHPLLFLRHPLWSRSLASTRKSRGRSTAPSPKTPSLPRSWDPIRIQRQWNHRFASPGAGYWECCLGWLCLRWPCSSDWALLEARVTTPLQRLRQQLPLHLLLRLPLQLRPPPTEARSLASPQPQFLPFPPILPQALQQPPQLAPLRSRPFLTSQTPPQPQPQPQPYPQQLPQLSAQHQSPQSQLPQWWLNQ